MKRILFSLILSSFAVLSSNAQYCTPTYTAGGCGSSTNTGIADYIDGVVTTGGTVNISNTSTACCGLANNYIFYSSLGHTGVQNTVVNYTLYNTPYWSEYMYIWVDWNQDGDFTDTTDYGLLTILEDYPTRKGDPGIYGHLNDPEADRIIQYVGKMKYAG